MVLHHLNIFFKKKFKRKCFAVKLKIIQISSPISNLPPSVHPVDGINALNYFFFKLTIYLFFFFKEKGEVQWRAVGGATQEKIFPLHTEQRERSGKLHAPVPKTPFITAPIFFFLLLVLISQQQKSSTFFFVFNI